MELGWIEDTSQWRIVPCRGIFLGNALDGRILKEIWNSKEFKVFRKELIKIRNYPECGRCKHRLF